MSAEHLNQNKDYSFVFGNRNEFIIIVFVPEHGRIGVLFPKPSSIDNDRDKGEIQI